jgi:Carboxypeptidase regulatory-like domain
VALAILLKNWKQVHHQGWTRLRKRLNSALAVVALLLRAAVCHGADPTFTLHGRVIDEDGLPVGGAQVRLEYVGPPSSGGSPTETTAGQSFSASSDDTGAFTIANLSAGQFAVRIEKASFFVLTGQKIELSQDTTEFTFTLNYIEEVREKVDVSSATDRIDPTSTAETATLNSTEIRDIPVPSSHTLQQSLIAMPQVLHDNLNLLHIAGARTTQAQYLLDGFEIGDPISGQLDARFSVDAVRTAEVQTAGFGSEYYHPAAAILSFHTPEGDDRFRFGAVDFIPGISIQNGVQLGNFYPRFSFSGPIEKGKLWYSESLSVQHTLSIVNGLPSNADTVQQWSGDSLTRLLWLIAPNHSLHGSFLYNQTSVTNAGLSTITPESTTSDFSSHRIFGSLKDQLWVGKTLYEFGLAADESYANSVPQGSAPYILLVNGSEGNYYQRLHSTGHRYQGFFDAIITGFQWHGSHTISVGANLSSVDVGQSATRTEIQALRADLTLARFTTFTGPANFHVSDALAGGFVQDLWTINPHLVAQVGVRGDWDRFVQGAIAGPRLALNYLPFADNRTKFSVGWGMYSIPLNLSVIGQTKDQKEVDTLYDVTGKVPTSGPATSEFVLSGKGYQVPYFQIANIGWQQRLWKGTLMGLELLARDEHHGLVYETVPPGQIGALFVLETSRRDRYRAMTVTARHSWENGAYLFGSYTRSTASTDQALDPFLGLLYFAPQQPAALSWDAPNRILSWGNVPTPLWGLQFNFFYEYRSGYPFSVINQQQFLVGPPNALHFPVYSNLTVSLEKKFHFTGRLFAVRVAVVNILNRTNPDTVVNNIDAIGTTPNFLTFSGGQDRAITARLRFISKK